MRFALNSAELRSRGVPVEVVMQALNAQTALLPFDIDLECKLLTPPLMQTVQPFAPPQAVYDPAAPTSSFPPDVPVASHPSTSASSPDHYTHDVNPETGEHRLEFFLPCEKAGGVLGKAGRVLKVELSAPPPPIFTNTYPPPPPLHLEGRRVYSTRLLCAHFQPSCSLSRRLGCKSLSKRAYVCRHCLASRDHH
mgnify:CR=1 FL=1